MTRLKVTQVRSVIHRPKDQKQTVRQLLGGATVTRQGWRVGRSGLSMTYIASRRLCRAAQVRRRSALASFWSFAGSVKATWNCLR